MKDTKRCTRRIGARDPMISSPTTTGPTTASGESKENLWYLCTTLLILLMYTVASPDPDPDPNPREGFNYLTLRVQFYANEGRDANP